jgi:parallel beta-helix repeat protein
MRTPIKITLASVLALAATAVVPSVAGAISCGDFIRQDVVLKSDLDCSAGGTGALIVAKDGITIDLGGHKIIGAGALDGYEGIENEGYDQVTIKNGSIENFSHAIYLSNVAKNRITKIKTRSGGGNGIYSSYGTGNRILGNRFYSPKYGVELINGSQNLIRGNRFKHAGRAVFSTNEAFDEVKNNVSEGFSISTYAYFSEADFRSVYTGDVANGGYYGFAINHPRGTVLDGVEANDNGYAGIYIDGAAGVGYNAKVLGSTANDNGEYGIYGAFGITSRNNTAMGNGFYNCHLAACNGRAAAG